MPAIFVTALTLLAHNPDTSYLRVRISPEQIETRLTYDVFTLLKIRQLDDNRDGQLQRIEFEGHSPQLADFFRSKVGLAISDEDDTADIGEFKGCLWPEDLGDTIRGVDFHTANGLIHFDFVRPLTEPPSVVAVAFGFFDVFTARHTVLGVFDCRGDKYEWTFTNVEDVFEYPTGYEPSQPQLQYTLGQRLWRFFKEGVKHIFEGYDHICFLIGLIVVSRFREIVKIVTSFTIAHSITLILAALDIVRLDTRLIESCIAATIVYVAAENIWLLLPLANSADSQSLEPRLRHRWWLTFFFGLVHGFGFANVLRGLELPTVGFIRCLLAFNFGVEVGQLAIAICLLPLAYGLTRWKYGRHAAIGISVVLGLFGSAWLIDRVFNLGLMERIGL